MNKIKRIAFDSHEHTTGQTLHNEYWFYRGEVIHHRVTDSEGRVVARWADDHRVYPFD